MMRSIHLRSLDDYDVELERVATAHASNMLTATGNWTPGQILGHLAAWIDYGYAGYPMSKLPSPVQWLLRFALRRALKHGMKPGVRIPGTKTGTVGDDDIPFELAFERLKRSIGRLRAGEEATFDSPAFGKMTHADRIALNLRHAELHLAFLSINPRTTNPRTT